MISKITSQQIKLDLIKSLDHYGIRNFFDALYLADTTLNTGITIYNEKKIFGEKLNEKEILTSNDHNYNKRTKISFLQKHERFCHIKKIFNKSEVNYVDSPRGYIDFIGNKFLLLVSKNNEENREIGEAFEYLLTNGKIELIDNLYDNKKDSFDYKNLFNIDIMLEKTNEKLIDLLIDIPQDPEDNKTPEKDNNEHSNNLGLDGQRKYKIFVNKRNKVDDKKIKNLDKYIEEKNKMINENTFRKFTFEKNTIRSYKYDYLNHKFIPDE